MIRRALLSLACCLSAGASSAFVPSSFPNSANGGAVVPSLPGTAVQMGAESEVSFGELDGSNIRIGILRTRWNDEHVSSLVEGIQAGLKECKVAESNVFVKEVPGAYELPYAAKLLALSGTVDAIVCCGVLIKGDTLHFEYIADAVSTGIMNVGITTMTPCVFGVLTCLSEEQVKARSSGDNNHGVDWGKTAVEMAIMKNEALRRGGQTGGEKAGLTAMGFGAGTPLKTAEKKTTPGFF